MKVSEENLYVDSGVKICKKFYPMLFSVVIKKHKFILVIISLIIDCRLFTLDPQILHGYALICSLSVPTSRSMEIQLWF